MAGAFQLSAFQNSAFQTSGAVVASYPAPAGGVAGRGGKRKKYVFPDGSKRLLSRDELEDALETVLVATPVERGDDTPAPRVAAKDRQIVAVFPSYPDLRDLFLAANQIEAAQALRRVAQRLADEEDERDVEMLLWG